MFKTLIIAALGLLMLDREALALCTSYTTLSNGTTADATVINNNFNCAALTSGATLNSTSFTGTTSFSNGSGNTISLDKPNGPSIQFSESGAPKYLIEDDSVTTSALGIYSWGGSSFSNIANFKSNGAFLVNTSSQPIGSAPRYLIAYGGTGGVATLFYNDSAQEETDYWANISSGAASFVNFIYGSSTTAVGSITTNGTSTAFNTTSDARLKTIAATQQNYRDAIAHLWVGDFVWKSNNKADFGIIAQQIYPLFPEAVSKPTNEAGIWKVDYGKLAPLALWGVKDLYQASTSQAREIAELRVEVQYLTKVISAMQRVNATSGSIRSPATQKIAVR